eukprot:3059274-Pleurochrysis_carterae.AAC.2
MPRTPFGPRPNCRAGAVAAPGAADVMLASDLLRGALALSSCVAGRACVAVPPEGFSATVTATVAAAVAAR